MTFGIMIKWWAHSDYFSCSEFEAKFTCIFKRLIKLD